MEFCCWGFLCFVFFLCLFGCWLGDLFVDIWSCFGCLLVCLFLCGVLWCLFVFVLGFFFVGYLWVFCCLFFNGMIPRGLQAQLWCSSPQICGSISWSSNLPMSWRLVPASGGHRAKSDYIHLPLSFSRIIQTGNFTIP